MSEIEIELYRSHRAALERREPFEHERATAIDEARGFGAALPFSRQRHSHLTAELTLTSKRSEASRRDGSCLWLFFLAIASRGRRPTVIRWLTIRASRIVYFRAIVR